MKFNVSRFNDLGKCCFGTLLGEFDTERDVIMETNFQGDAIQKKIKTLDDLFKYLWYIPSILHCHDGVTTAVFHSDPYPWWVERGEYWWDNDGAMEEVKKLIREDNKNENG